jgi:SNF2 family DNA or RNA helicase
VINDLDWVPANIVQLYKRADRMGQKKFVNVYFVIACGTFDEEMQVMLESKLAVVNEFEEVQGSLFLDLIARLAVAPQNPEVRQAYEQRMMGVAKRNPAA